MVFCVHAERDSVCMGDDCLAPNAQDFSFRTDVSRSCLLAKLVGYVPDMREVVWSVRCGQEPIGYLCPGFLGGYRWVLEGEDGPISELPEPRVFCSYYTAWRVDHLLPADEASGSATLLERVRQIERGRGVAS